MRVGEGQKSRTSSMTRSQGSNVLERVVISHPERVNRMYKEGEMQDVMTAKLALTFAAMVGGVSRIDRGVWLGMIAIFPLSWNNRRHMEQQLSPRPFFFIDFPHTQFPRPRPHPHLHPHPLQNHFRWRALRTHQNYLE